MLLHRAIFSLTTARLSWNNLVFQYRGKVVQVLNATEDNNDEMFFFIADNPVMVVRRVDFFKPSFALGKQRSSDVKFNNVPAGNQLHLHVHNKLKNHALVTFIVYNFCL